MKIYKFGGASLKNSEGVKNLSKIIKKNGKAPLVIVVSAMAKTTNALEELAMLAFNKKECSQQFDRLFNFHFNIATELFIDRSHPVFGEISQVFEHLKALLGNEKFQLNYDMYYDQVVSQGEMLSSIIAAHYLNLSGIKTRLFDVREAVKTDDTFREGKVEWEVTARLIKEKILPLTEKSIVLTQGFIGCSLTNLTTTLGREGSDFTAAIFAACLDAESVTIWKDVPGVLNADPRLIKTTIKFDELSYNEAAEMAYYGAQVIHPKTIKPLANKNIPLWVKSFEHPEEEGTIIHGTESRNLPPTIVIKSNQFLISFHVKDLAFINENNLSLIFHSLDRLNIRINLMQNSAVSFSICIDYNEKKIEELLKVLEYSFDIKHNEKLLLITIKNYDQKTIDELNQGREILLEQKTRNTYQIVVADK